VTFKVILVLQAFQMRFLVVVQTFTMFQLTQHVARFLYDSWASRQNHFTDRRSSKFAAK